MADLSAAEAYLAANCLNTSAWDAADPTVKQKALAQATNEITSLPWRANAPSVNCLNAIYEQAAFLLDTQGEASRLNLQAAGVASVGISGGASETYRTGANRYGFTIAPGAQKWIRGWLTTSALVR